MLIKIEPHDAASGNGFRVIVNGWGTGPTYSTYDGACAVADTIAKHAVNPSGYVRLDYSRCLQQTSAK